MDLGTRMTKAVHLQRRGQGFALCGYLMLDAPVYDRVLSPEMLSEHLKSVSQAFLGKTKNTVLTVGVQDSVIRVVDVPRIPQDQLRPVIRLNSRAYLQQDLSGYAFDCVEVGAAAQPKAPAPAPGAAGPGKHKILFAGAKEQLVSDYDAGAKAAGLPLHSLMPGLIGPVNAFELAMPELFQKEVAVLVDVGFRSSSICLLDKGELVLTRVVGVAGDQLTTALSEAMQITYPEAESLKIGLAHEVRAALESVLIPLGRELRASLDYFEHQQDRQVTQVFVSGGSTRSDLLVAILQGELAVECKTWDPTRPLQKDLPPEQAAQLEEVGPQLAVAVGAALAVL
ncbi:MAG: pilus assembly protein PilM [Verrucomicrobiota bacterium]